MKVTLIVDARACVVYDDAQQACLNGVGGGCDDDDDDDDDDIENSIENDDNRETMFCNSFSTRVSFYNTDAIRMYARRLSPPNVFKSSIALVRCSVSFGIWIFSHFGIYNSCPVLQIVASHNVFI